MQKRPSAATLLLAVALSVMLAVGAAGGAVAAGGFSVDVGGSQSVDVPPRTVSVDGTEFEVTTLAVVDEDETLTVDVTAPNDDVYSTNVYNPDEQIVDYSRGEGSHAHSFAAADLEGPGTYSIGVVQDGEVGAVQPLVVSGYAFDVAIPDELPADEVAEVELAVTETTADGAPGGVELVFADDADETRIEADHVDGEMYVATVDATTLEEGEYGAYAVALERAGGENAVGVSDRHTVTVVEPEPDPEGAVAGTVTDEESGEPVADVTITATKNGEPLAETTTDAEGAYHLEGLEPDEYTLEWQADGYESATEAVTVTSGETTTVDLELTPVEEGDDDEGDGDEGDEGDEGGGDEGDEGEAGDGDEGDEGDGDEGDEGDEGDGDESGGGDSDEGDEGDDGEHAADDHHGGDGDERTDDHGDGTEGDDHDHDQGDDEGVADDGDGVGAADDEAGDEGDDALTPTLPADDGGEPTEADDDIGMPVVVLTILAIASLLTYALRRR